MTQKSPPKKCKIFDNETAYVDKIELSKILEVFESIPHQLSKENKKFQYSVWKPRHL